jgi:GNAT superfamily N-acetyltransferase
LNYDLNKTRRKITYKNNNIYLPFGIMYFLKRTTKEESSIDVKKNDYYLAFKKSKIKFKILPPFKMQFTVKREKYDIFIVNSDKDKLDCQSLILHEHYLQPPNKGMFIACRFKKDIIGCCIIDELVHGNPRARLYVSPEITNANGWTREKWRDLDRSEVRKSLNLCWLSRIVVSKKYRRQGVGTKMVESLPSILSSYHPLKPNYIEVITTHEKEGNTSYSPPENNNIFCKSGYSYRHLSTHTHNVLRNGNYEPKPADRYYFWKEIS